MGVLDVIKSNNITLDPTKVDVDKVKLILGGLNAAEVDKLVADAKAQAKNIVNLGNELKLLLDLGELLVKGALKLL